MITISLCMIVKNEESCLSKCLESARDLVDEIIIVDTGSTDKTKDIAYTYTDKVFDFTWVNDFSKARNFSFSKASCDYQMWLDADDFISPENQKKILYLKSNLDPNIDIVTFKYNTNFDNFGNPTLTSTRARLMKRNKNYSWNDPVHEYIQLSGNILYVNNIFITHAKQVPSTDRNLKIYETNLKNGMTLSPRGKYYFARELKNHNRNIEAVYYFEQFLQEGKGWKEDNIATCFNLAICYLLLNERTKILPILIKSFEYDSPRAEITCQIGYYFMQCEDYKTARDWFLLTTRLDNKDIMGFKLNDYWYYIPHIELAVCYYKLGDLHNAIHHNEIAAKYKPQSDAVIHNKNFFEKISTKDV